jgi:alkanesulfonate monooxygenase SsuD/methylene tetrahydromethanopterin reductase-like flavin-dependent oxidoreductase (luciferase family)
MALAAKSEFWDHGLESFTLMAGLAAVTKRIKLFASTGVLTIPPAIVARMAVTIDNISGGRFGVNIEIVSAGQSDTGMAFGAEFYNYNSRLGEGVNAPTKAASVPARVLEHAKKTGRDVGA